MCLDAVLKDDLQRFVDIIGSPERFVKETSWRKGECQERMSGESKEEKTRKELQRLRESSMTPASWRKEGCGM